MATRNRTYTRPLLEVFQMLEVTRSLAGEHLYTCIIGPNYDLYRHGYEDLPTATYNAETEQQTIPFAVNQAENFDYKLDTGSVEVHADGLEGRLSTIESTDESIKLDASDYMTVRMQPGTNSYHLFAASTAAGKEKLAPALHGFGVQIGDIVYVTAESDGTPRRLTVVDVAGKLLPSNVEDGDSNVASGGYALGTDIKIAEADKASYTGKKNTTYVIVVESVAHDTETSKTHVEFRVSDTESEELVSYAGIDIPDAGTSAIDLMIGTRGVKATVTPGTNKEFHAGDAYTFVATAAFESATEFDGLKLSATPVDLATWTKTDAFASVEIRKEFTGLFGRNGDSWSIVNDAEGAPQVVVEAGASLNVPGRSSSAPAAVFADGVGKLSLSFRVLKSPEDGEDIFEIDELDDITNNFGTIAPENDLAYGCFCAFAGSAGRLLFAIRTQGPTPEDFLAGMRKTEADNAVYGFAPITEDLEVMHTVAEFNDRMSEPAEKKWRQTFIGVENAGQYKIADHAMSDGSSVQLTASFSVAPGVDGGKATVMQITPTLEFDLRNVAFGGTVTSVHAGDLVRLGVNGAYYTVKEVLSDKELVLRDGPSTAVSNKAISIWKADTASNNVEFIGNAANSFNNRRDVMVWCDHGVKVEENTSTHIKNKYLAAEIAGLSSAVVPQQSLTRTEVSSITSAPRMYTKYTQAQLDEIASYGVLIVTQDTKGKPCYIRHQLTTDAMNGNLYSEMSCTRNLDSISYGIVDRLEQYVGKANVTPSALIDLKTDVTNYLVELTTNGTDDKIGPSLVDWKNLQVYQDPKVKNRVIVTVDLYLPLPMNNIRVYTMAYEATVII